MVKQSETSCNVPHTSEGTRATRSSKPRPPSSDWSQADDVDLFYRPEQKQTTYVSVTWPSAFKCRCLATRSTKVRRLTLSRLNCALLLLKSSTAVIGPSACALSCRACKYTQSVDLLRFIKKIYLRRLNGKLPTSPTGVSTSHSHSHLCIARNVIHAYAP